MSTIDKAVFGLGGWRREPRMVYYSEPHDITFQWGGNGWIWMVTPKDPPWSSGHLLPESTPEDFDAWYLGLSEEENRLCFHQPQLKFLKYKAEEKLALIDEWRRAHP